jgi:uracil-DNA glycosylase family protein
LTVVEAEAADCRRCDLWKAGTQTVFGAGPARAAVMLVGEQPGDHEDLEGEPFVGPAGRLLDRAIDAAGGDRSQLYLTNAVKHFKWTPRGKRRIHQRPDQAEVEACRFWLDEEIRLVRPDVVVLLGATAAQSRLGRSFKVTQHRSEDIASDLAPHVFATVHPSSLLRMKDGREEAFAAFVDDLRVAFAHAA